MTDELIKNIDKLLKHKRDYYEICKNEKSKEHLKYEIIMLQRIKNDIILRQNKFDYDLSIYEKQVERLENIRLSLEAICFWHGIIDLPSLLKSNTGYLFDLAKNALEQKIYQLPEGLNK